MTRRSYINEPSSPAEAFNLFRKWDICCLSVLIYIGIWFSIDSNLDYITKLPVGDREFYINMAIYPPGFLNNIPSPYAQRFLPSVLVWSGVKFFGLTFSQGFRFLSYFSYSMFLPLVYFLMRTCSVPSQIALGVSLFCGISFWPVTSSLVNFYQACDGMFYPVCAVMMILTLRHNRFSLLIVSLMAILIRQQAFVLAILSFVHLYLKTKDRKSLIYIGFIVVGFGLLTHYAGTAGAQNLAKHTVFRIFDIASAARGVIQTKLPIMFSPFLLLLICYFKRTYRYMLRYWWATLFAMITILQPLLSFDITGVFDAQRLIMMGVWPFFILAGLLLRDTLKSRWAKWTFLILPLLYGTEHLNILKHAYPTVLGHRIIMNGIILALILLDLYYRRQSRRGAS